jgi:hypothetical protein
LNNSWTPWSLVRCRRISLSLRDSSKQKNKLSMCEIKYTESPEIENYKTNE